jgi:hypothetical protein
MRQISNIYVKRVYHSMTKSLLGKIFGATNVHKYNKEVTHCSPILDQKANPFGVYESKIPVFSCGEPQLVIIIAMYMLPIAM